MKVLVICSYLSIDNYAPFSRIMTGYGKAVKDISSEIAKQGNKVFLISAYPIRKEYLIDDVCIKGIDIFTLALNMRLIELFKAVKRYKIHKDLKQILREIYQDCLFKYLVKDIKRNKYDIIHIHGAGYFQNKCAFYLSTINSPFLVTLHGIVDIQENTALEKYKKRLEKEYIDLSYKNKINTSMVSSGVLEKLLNNYNKKENYYIIGNGCVESNSKSYIGKKCWNKFVFLCIGNISKRKNQLQLVNAFTLLPENIKKFTYIYFLGNEDYNYNLRNEIIDKGLEEHLKVCGFVNSKDIEAYYNNADCTVLVSKSEGFGLSIIEGYTYGLPALVFKDLDAVKDLYSSDSMILVNDRSDESLKNGMVEMIMHNWNKEKIIKYSENFKISSIARKYIELYEKIMKLYKLY